LKIQGEYLVIPTCIFCGIYVEPLLGNYRERSNYIQRLGGTRLRNWLRHYATSRKVEGSSSDEMDFFNLPNPSSRTMALASTQPLTEMSTRRSIGL
jgi:hypothetical protein